MKIALLGFKGSGKDTVGSHLVSHYDFNVFSFAEPLKDAIAAIFLWDRELLDGKTVESRKWREIVDPWWSEKLGIPNFTPRMAMQLIGTDTIRKYVHDDIWILNLEKRLLNFKDKNVVIQDCRFMNELNLAKKYGSTIIRIKRGTDPTWINDAIELNKTMAWKNMPLNELMKIIPEHPSEWAWLGTNIDHVLENDSDIPSLLSQVDNILKQSSIL